MDKSLVEYFIVETNKKFDTLQLSLREMQEDVETIKRFRWQIISGSLVASVFITAIFQVAIVFITPN